MAQQLRKVKAPKVLKASSTKPALKNKPAATKPTRVSPVVAAKELAAKKQNAPQSRAAAGASVPGTKPASPKKEIPSTKEMAGKSAQKSSASLLKKIANKIKGAVETPDTKKQTTSAKKGPSDTKADTKPTEAKGKAPTAGKKSGKGAGSGANKKNTAESISGAAAGLLAAQGTEVRGEYHGKYFIPHVGARRARAFQTVCGNLCTDAQCEKLIELNGYCRLYYIRDWKNIKKKEEILKDGKLHRYIEELMAKYPDKYIEAIRQDLASDKDFSRLVRDLELDEPLEDVEGDEEAVENIIGDIRKGVEDEEEIF